MDVLFSGQKRLEEDIQDLIIYLKDNKLSERAELFVDGAHL